MKDGSATVANVELEAALAALKRDYSRLAPRIRALEHQVTCECDGVTLRLHFPALRQGKATVQELVNAIYLHLTPFALSNKERAEVIDLYGKVSAEAFQEKTTALNAAAAALFIKAQKTTKRTGEAGELLLYLLTEWVLEAPQIIAKMTLKTNPQMPVYGSDGVHVRYCPKSSRLFIYWGESKIHADVDAAITAAATSIAKALTPAETEHELQLVKRHIDFSAMNEPSKAALLQYLDPHDEAYNERHDVVTCLIGFNFDGFQEAAGGDAGKAEDAFRELAKARLAVLAPKVAAAFRKAGLDKQQIELFFFPLPTVEEFRTMFQQKIGWQP